MYSMDVVGCEVVDQAATGLPDAERIRSLIAHRDQVEIALLDEVRRFAAERAFEDDGCWSMAGWLIRHAGLTRSHAQRLATLADALVSMPATETAVRDGRLTVAKAELLAKVINPRTRDDFCDHETELVGHACRLTGDDLRLALRAWSAMADPDGADPDDQTRNELRITRDFNGRVRFEADLDPTSGQIVESVLDAIADLAFRNPADTNEGTVERRGRRLSLVRAEALVEMARRATAAVAADAQPGLSPEIVVVVRQVGEDATLVELNKRRVAAFVAAELACNARIARLVVDAAGEALDLGRSVRTATPAQRRAVVARDGGCRFPDCGAPATWCQVHHLQEWDDGGPTDINNLALLCHFHHRLLHRKHWTLRRDPERGCWCITTSDSAIYPWLLRDTG